MAERKSMPAQRKMKSRYFNLFEENPGKKDAERRIRKCHGA